MDRTRDFGGLKMILMDRTQDFGGLKMILMDRIVVPDVPLKVYYFFTYSIQILFLLSLKFSSG